MVEAEQDTAVQQERRLRNQHSELTAVGGSEENNIPGGNIEPNSYDVDKSPDPTAGSGGQDGPPSLSAQRGSSDESYQQRKISLARTGELIPAFKHSTLKGDPICRVDRKGNEIGRDRKKYQLTYIDQIEKKPLVQVHCVESYKKYNAEDPQQGDTPCCTIF